MTTKLMQSPKRQRCTVGTSVSVVEKARKDFEALDRVAREYRADGLDVIPAAAPSWLGTPSCPS
ncbi:MAG TPA: hypothetical protein VFK36_07955 [Gemmatimonadales bacterium]|jgi:hypothetical protein|nr:hypothetical protein [Gemmatimonadales bacterium]